MIFGATEDIISCSFQSVRYSHCNTSKQKLCPSLTKLKNLSFNVHDTADEPVYSVHPIGLRTAGPAKCTKWNGLRKTEQSSRLVSRSRGMSVECETPSFQRFTPYDE